MQVYVNGVMGIHFCVSFLLLLGTDSLSGGPSPRIRLVAAALLGAVYSGVCMLPSFRFLGNILWRTVSLGLMGSIAFGWNRQVLRKYGIFLLLSLALGGIANRIPDAAAWELVASAAGLWLLCRLLRFEEGGRDAGLLPLKICNGTRSVSLMALRDTGNALRDPVTGEQILVVSRAAAVQLTGLSEEQIRHPLDTVLHHPISGLRLVPFRTIGQGNGMMLAMRFEDILMDGRRGRSVVAFAPENFGSDAGYQALAGGELLW